MTTVTLLDINLVAGLVWALVKLPFVVVKWTARRIAASVKARRERKSNAELSRLQAELQKEA